MANRLPHPVKNGHGTYYFRLYVSGREQRLSLGTKDFQRAKIQVLELNLKLATSIDPDKLFRKLDLVVDPDTGQVTLTDVKEADINTAQTVLDHLGVPRAQTMGIDHLLTLPKKSKTSKPILLASGSRRASAVGGMASQSGTHKNIRDVIALYLVEKKLDNVEKLSMTKMWLITSSSNLIAPGTRKSILALLNLNQIVKRKQKSNQKVGRFVA